MDYECIDCGYGKRIERFGRFILERPCGIALWPLTQTISSDAVYTRRDSKFGDWSLRTPLPKQWQIAYAGIQFLIQPTSFGHVGLFAEHGKHFDFLRQHSRGEVLNLFAYSGGASLAIAQGGASVCHVDASKGMVSWAKENAKINGLEGAPIRWITDDAVKFVKRELKRGRTYQGIVLDPPTFGRGSQGQVFKIEEDLFPLLQSSQRLLSEDGYCLLTCHTPGFSPLVLMQLLQQAMGPSGRYEAEEMWIDTRLGKKLPLGAYCLWRGQ